MPKNAVKTEAAEPISEIASSNPSGQNDHMGTTRYTEKMALGGPIPIVMGGGRMACRMKLSGKILERSGLKANDKVELIAGENEIIIRKVGEPAPGLPFKSTTGTTRMLDALMAATREKEAEMKAAREQRYAYQEETEAEAEGVDGAAPLNLEQIDQEVR